MNGPIIEGARVKLRPHQEDDAVHFVRMLADPKVNRYLGRQDPPSLKQELEWIEAKASDQSTCGWTVEVDGKPVGVVGFDQINWQNGTATVGIFIGEPELWGGGIATEIAQLLADFAFMQLGLRKVKSGFLAPNVASGRLQASVGLREVGCWHGEFFRDGEWVDHVLTECLREDWLATRQAQLDPSGDAV